MDYFHRVVEEYLRSNRARFINSECLIQLDNGKDVRKDRHWYCDFLVVDFFDRTVYLCEVTFARGLQSLTKRLNAWSRHWPEVREAIFRECQIPMDWGVKPWLFIPESYEASVLSRIVCSPAADGHAASMPVPKLTTLESILPWKYRSWDGTHYVP
jgi:hypothetical protein